VDIALFKQPTADRLAGATPAVTVLKDELPDRHPRPGRDVGSVGVLDEPAGVLKLLVDPYPRSCLARQVGVIWVTHGQ
jgi:hypothetical protein